MTDNNELNQRFDQLEKRLDNLAVDGSLYNFKNRSPRTDGIDLRNLFFNLWQGKWWIIGVTILFSVVGIFYSVNLPNTYKSEGVYAPEENDKGSNLTGQYGGLAAIAGIQLNGKGNEKDQIIALANSWAFLEQLISKYELKPYIMAVREWDELNNRIIWDEAVYSPESKKWLRDPPPGKEAEPSSFETFNRFKSFFAIDYDQKKNLFNISINYFDPNLSERWVRLIVSEINQHFQRRDIEEASRSVDYLKQKIGETSVAEMQKVFYGMIESQTKTLMLAEVSNQYVLKTVVPPKVSEHKSGPNRALICLLFVFLGGGLSVTTLIIKIIANNFN